MTMTIERARLGLEARSPRQDPRCRSDAAPPPRHTQALLLENITLFRSRPRCNQRRFKQLSPDQLQGVAFLGNCIFLADKCPSSSGQWQRAIDFTYDTQLGSADQPHVSVPTRIHRIVSLPASSTTSNACLPSKKHRLIPRA
jgi:hypothetical protein